MIATTTRTKARREREALSASELVYCIFYELNAVESTLEYSVLLSFHLQYRFLQFSCDSRTELRKRRNRAA